MREAGNSQDALDFAKIVVDYSVFNRPVESLLCCVQDQYLEALGFSGAVAKKLSWSTVAGIISAAALLAIVAGFAIHKWRMRRMMQTEIQSIM